MMMMMMMMMVVWCRVDDKSRGRTVKFERQLVADRQRYMDDDADDGCLV